MAKAAAKAGVTVERIVAEDGCRCRSCLNRNEQVQSRIEELVAKAAEKAGVTVERIVNELAKISASWSSRRRASLLAILQTSLARPDQSGRSEPF